MRCVRRNTKKTGDFKRAATLASIRCRSPVAGQHQSSREKLLSWRSRHLLYLHGFRSSPASAKAVPHGPVGCHPARPGVRLPAAAALTAATRWPWWPALVASWPASRAQPSSAARWAASTPPRWPSNAAHRGWRAAVLNPAVNPARDLASAISATLTAWHDPDAEVRLHGPARGRAGGADAASTPEPPASRYYALIAKGDELLDWREMLARYAGCDGEVVDGSDHGLTRLRGRICPPLSGAPPPAEATIRPLCLRCLMTPESSSPAG